MNTPSEFSSALTQAALGKLPPELRIATGHEDKVMLFLLRVTDPDATTQVLMDAITLSETDAIVESLKVTGGLIRKPFPIEEAWRLKDQLVVVGTEVEFVRPHDQGLQ